MGYIQRFNPAGLKRFPTVESTENFVKLNASMRVPERILEYCVAGLLSVVYDDEFDGGVFICHLNMREVDYDVWRWFYDDLTDLYFLNDNNPTI